MFMLNKISESESDRKCVNKNTLNTNKFRY